MRDLATRIRRAYGANPLHLLALLVAFALTGYVVTRLVHQPQLIRMLIWFAGAIVGHDLILFPLYAFADRSVRAGLRRLWPRSDAAPPVPPLNYIRVPALGAGLLFLIFFPGILRLGRQTYMDATAQDQQPYFGRWLLLTAVMFAISAACYALALRRARSPSVRPDRSAEDSR
jgi:methylthioxylose transferase